MPQRYLKVVRVLVSLFFLATTFLVFFDLLGELPPRLIDSILYLQFTPSLIAFIHSAGLASSGFLFVLLATLMAGRLFCSFICPLGGMQDVFIYANKQLKKKKHSHHFSLQPPLSIVRYGILIVTVVSCFTGNLLILSLFDPFSQFGRVSADLIRPFIISVHNLLADSAQWLGIYIIFPLDYKAPPPATLILPLAVFTLLLYFTAKKGRLFCNSLCPLGTLLGLLSNHTLFKITINQQKCTQCATCITVCKAGCIDLKNKKIDTSRCISCFNCIHSCPEAAVHFHSSVKNKPCNSPGLSIERRALIFSFLSIFFYHSSRASTPQKPVMPQIRNRLPTTIANEKQLPVLPPGGKSIKHFNSSCTSCHLCISACPTGVLQPSINEYGINGFLNPFLDTTTSFCNFDCIRCGEVCPTGAIQLLTVKSKKLTQMGKTQFIKKNCVVETDKKDCGACAEHCPTKAVRMVPYEGKLKIPELDNKYCIGCGACEHICPVRPHRAIFVDGLPEQGIAEPPVSQPVTVIPMEDFPF